MRPPRRIRPPATRPARTRPGISAGPNAPHVVFFDHCARMSGAEISMLNTIGAIDSRVTVILGEDGPLVQRLEGAGATVEVLPLPKTTATFSRNRIGPSIGTLSQVLQVLTYARQLARIMRRVSADVVVSNSMKGHVIVSAARLFGVFPVVFHLHDRIVPEFMSSAGVRLERLLIRTVPRAIVANSRSTMATAPRSPRHRIRVITGGPIAPPPPAGLRPVSGGRPLTLGLVGRLSPWKGQDVAIRAFAIAFPDGKEVLEFAGTALFGEDEFVDSLHQLVESLGLVERIRFLGHVDDVYDRLREWDVVLHTSTIPEPFGLVVAQAMAVGRPVIASSEGGPGEIIDEGETGLLVTPRNPQELAAAIQRAANDPDLRARLGAAASLAVRDYLPDVAASRLMTAVAAAQGV